MKNLRKIITLVMLAFTLSASANLEVFTFTMTEISVVQGSNLYPPNKKLSNIEVNVADNGEFVLIGEKNYNLGEFERKSWYINDINSLCIKNNDDNLFLVNLEKQVINVKNGDSILLFSNPQNAAQFKSVYNNLYNYLVKIGKLKRNSSSSSSSSGASAPPASLNGKEFNLGKMLGHPFGVNPVFGKKCTLDDIGRAAKQVYGWNLQFNQKTKSAGFVWPQLNGMKFQGFPIYELKTFEYNGADDWPYMFFCTIIIPDTSAAKNNMNNLIVKYMKSLGWIRDDFQEGRPRFYKGNTIVECYTQPDDKFSGKQEYVIDVQTYKDAQTVKNIIGSQGFG